jgi:hypothetical protein
MMEGSCFVISVTSLNRPDIGNDNDDITFSVKIKVLRTWNPE